MRTAIVISLALLLSIHSSYAQKDFSWEEYLTEQYENSEEAAVSMEEAYEHLVTLAQQPLDINSAETEDFLMIPGLDMNQISDILEYRDKYGNMRSMDELMLITSIDDRMRRFLCCFLTVRDRTPQAWYLPEELQKGLQHLRHSLTATAAIPTYYRAADKGATAPSAMELNKYANAYLGDPTKHSLRYSVTMDDHVTLNLTGAKAAGEPFFTHGNYLGYDRYAYNLVIKKLGPVRRLILGKFKAQFGMGLTLNNSISIGKQAMQASAGRIANVFTPHSSTSDYKHLNGIAATVDIKDLTLSAFWSYRPIDATLNDDGTISTILTSNYHRTDKEREKMGNAHLMTTGVHAEYPYTLDNGLQLSIGASAVYSWSSRPLNPIFSKGDTISWGKIYRMYYPQGTSFWNAAINYSAKWRDLILHGETATGDCGQIATVNALSWRLSPLWSLMAAQRYYAYQYNALYGRSFGDGSNVQNESGLCLQAQYKPLSWMVIDAYSDMAYYPWPQYRITGSSYAMDNSISSTATISRWTLALRYRLKIKQRDHKDDNGVNSLLWKTDQHLRFIATYEDGIIKSRTQLEGCTLDFDHRSMGFIISQSASYLFTLLSLRWDASVSVAYFHTDDYDSKIYAYERGMLYNMSFNSYYGHGIRYSALLKTDLTHRLSATLKAGHTHYFDRRTIGTAERQIFSRHLTDIEMQLRVKF